MSTERRIPGFLYFLVKPWLTRKGFGSIGGRRVADMFYDDLVGYRGAGLKQKMWAYRHGFLSDRILRYGLNADNLKDYMPDAHYYKLKAHLNSPLGNWYDNKLTTRFLLRQFDACMEDTYFFIKGGRMVPLMDHPAEMEPSAEGIARWVSTKGPLAAKAIKGSLGTGFLRLGFEDGKYFIDRTAMDEATFIKRVYGLNGYMIVGFLHCHEELRRIHDRAANALRVMSAYDYDLKRSVLTGAYMRFATDRSGYLEHVIHGGILAGVDITNGAMYRPLAFVGDRFVDIATHPDTGAPITGNVPNWQLIASKVLEISDTFPVTPHLTFDIIVTDDGFRVLEINSHSDISNIQIYYPYFKSATHRKLFAEVVDLQTELP